MRVQFYGTAGAAAQRLSHAINKVIVGSPAPEIIAENLDREPFRLSDLKGKITVLVFAQCVGGIDHAMYAPLRQLVAKYRHSHVQVVGIMSANERNVLTEAKAKGVFNWTVISQPLNGPLMLDWGIELFPTVYIVDDQGILLPPLHLPHYGEGGFDTEEIDEKLSQLCQRPTLRQKRPKTILFPSE